MKKILTWMTLLCMLLSFAALAEEPTVIDPFADPAEQTETAPEAEAPVEAEPEPTATAVNYALPDGQELYQFDTGNAPEWGLISVGEVNYDVLQARDADEVENTVRITARPGQKLIAVRLVFQPLADMPYDQAFDAKMQLGENLYVCRKYVETKKSGVVNNANTAGSSAEMEGHYCYLVNVDDATDVMEEKALTFAQRPNYMFDVYTLVPEEALANGEPVFLILTLGEKQFYCQVM